VQKYFDSLKEVLLYYVGLLVVGGLAFSLVEAKPLLDSMWWAVVTATSTGYGDVLPVTILGKLVGVVVMNIGILAIVPLITAHIASKLIVDNDTSNSVGRSLCCWYKIFRVWRWSIATYGIRSKLAADRWNVRIATHVEPHER